MPPHKPSINFVSYTLIMIDIETLLAWGGAYKKYVPGEIIFQEGAHCNYYYQLVEGCVRWVNINEDGKEFIQSIIQPEECFGELPLFDGEPYAASAVANENSLVIRLPNNLFTQLIKENPAIHLSFSKLASQRLRFKFLLLKTIAFENPELKISTLLNHLKSKQHTAKQQPYQVNLTRQQIAGMTGLRVETVIRAIRNLNKKGIVEINRGKVFL